MQRLPHLFPRVLCIAQASLFLFSILTVYVDFLSHRYTNMGFNYEEPDTYVFLISLAAALLPSAYLPIHCSSIKDFAGWILYYVLYMPSVTIPVLQGHLDSSDQLLLILSLSLSFLIILLPTRTRSFTRRAEFAPTRDLFWTGFFTVYLALIVYVVAEFGTTLRVVGLAEVYVQRFVADDAFDASFVGYATGFLSGGLNPFLITVGLFQRKPLLIAIGALGQVLVYATAALKAVFLSVVLIPVFYFILRKGRLNLNIIGFVFTSIAFGLMIIINSVDTDEDVILREVVALIYMRTFCMTGVLTGMYADFFLSHPLTYYSHINVVQVLIPYPYAAQVGQEIGLYLSPGALRFNANASFWATDGLAAMGFTGVILAGLLFRFFILIIDSVTSQTMLPVVSAALIPALVGVTNSSLFTTILSGGAGVLVLLFYFWTRLLESERSPQDSFSGLTSSIRGAP
jgi:hypothetical protein